MPINSSRLFIKERVLTPGPVDVPPAVLLEAAQPIIHHRTKAFRQIFESMTKKLQGAFKTKGPVLTIAGSGTTSFEAAMISLATPGPGSTVITVAAGKFGERWQDIYDNYTATLGIKNVKIDVPWGQAVTPGTIDTALKENPGTSVVVIVHSETSTATAADIKSIAAVTRHSNALLLVDGITAVGALPVHMDDWGVDCIVTGSQKALMLPPGLGYVALGPRAVAQLKETKAMGYYNLDLRRWLKSLEADWDVPFTPPVSLIRSQLVALDMIEKEGLENVWARSAKLAAASRAAFTALGMKLCSQSPSDSVTGAFYPEGIEDKKFRGALRDRYGFHVAGGQSGRGAKWEDKIFRISHMGYVDGADTLGVLCAIEQELRAQAPAAMAHVPAGAGVAAAARVMFA